MWTGHKTGKSHVTLFAKGLHRRRLTTIICSTWQQGPPFLILLNFYFVESFQGALKWIKLKSFNSAGPKQINNPVWQRYMWNHLISSLKRKRVPATGFVEKTDLVWMYMYDSKYILQLGEYFHFIYQTILPSGSILQATNQLWSLPSLWRLGCYCIIQLLLQKASCFVVGEASLCRELEGHSNQNL